MRADAQRGSAFLVPQSVSGVTESAPAETLGCRCRLNLCPAAPSATDAASIVAARSLNVAASSPPTDDYHAMIGE